MAYTGRPKGHPTDRGLLSLHLPIASGASALVPGPMLDGAKQEGQGNATSNLFPAAALLCLSSEHESLPTLRMQNPAKANNFWSPWPQGPGKTEETHRHLDRVRRGEGRSLCRSLFHDKFGIQQETVIYHFRGEVDCFHSSLKRQPCFRLVAKSLPLFTLRLRAAQAACCQLSRRRFHMAPTRNPQTQPVQMSSRVQPAKAQPRQASERPTKSRHFGCPT